MYDCDKIVEVVMFTHQKGAKNNIILSSQIYIPTDYTLHNMALHCQNAVKKNFLIDGAEELLLFILYIFFHQDLGR